MNSYGLFDSAFMKLVCNSYIEQYNKILDREREVAITKEMSKRFFPAKTREKAIKRLEEDMSIFSQISESFIMGFNAMNTKCEVEQVLGLTEFNTQVYVSGELFQDMCDLLPKELKVQ